MRTEHRTTADEWDLMTDWRHYLTCASRPGARKAVKTAGHRRDRRTAKQAAIREQTDCAPPN